MKAQSDVDQKEDKIADNLAYDIQKYKATPKQKKEPREAANTIVYHVISVSDNSAYCEVIC